MSGFASVCIALWLKAKQRSDIGATPFWVIGAVCLLLAFFLAWRDEQRGRIAAEFSLQETATPHLEGSIEMIDVGHLESTDELRSVVLVWLRVRNQGVDSIAEGHHLQIVIGGKEIGRWIPNKIPRSIHFGTMSIPEADSGSIYEKTVDHVIPRGSQAKGLLMFLVRGIAMDTLTQSSVTYNVIFHDVKDRNYIASHTMTGKLYSPVCFPFDIPGTPGFRRESEIRAKKGR